MEEKEDDSLCSENQFNEFFRKHARLLRNYLYYKFGSAHEAEDVVQESFIKLWDNCDKVTPGSAKGYLYTIASNLSTSIKRHDKVKLKYEEQAVKTSLSSESPEFIILEKEFMEKLTAAIGSLPDKQREVYLLNRVEKKTYKEIAELSGVTVKAIEKLMHKALLKLRKEIGDLER